MNLDLNGDRNLLRDVWDRLSPLPGGKRVFSMIIGRGARYTGTIGARVTELSPGHCRVVMRDRPAVRNHLECVHAVALANLAEIAGNLALWYALPDDARFIIAGMSFDYVKKARGSIEGRCDMEVLAGSERAEILVPVTLHDRSGDVVVRAELRSLVGPKRR